MIRCRQNKTEKNNILVFLHSEVTSQDPFFTPQLKLKWMNCLSCYKLTKKIHLLHGTKIFAVQFFSRFKSTTYLYFSSHQLICLFTVTANIFLNFFLPVICSLFYVEESSFLSCFLPIITCCCWQSFFFRRKIVDKTIFKI